MPAGEPPIQRNYPVIASICIWGEYPIAKDRGHPHNQAPETKGPASDLRKIAFLGDFLLRKCGIATFTCDVLSAMAAEHPEI